MTVDLNVQNVMFYRDQASHVREPLGHAIPDFSSQLITFIEVTQRHAVAATASHTFNPSLVKVRR